MSNDRIVELESKELLSVEEFEELLQLRADNDPKSTHNLRQQIDFAKNLSKTDGENENQ